MIEGGALKYGESRRKDIQGSHVVGVSGEATFDAYEATLGFSAIFGYIITAGASSAGVHRGNRDDLAPGPDRLVLQLSPVFGPSLIHDGFVQACLLPNHFAGLIGGSRRRARHIANLQVFDTDQTVGFGLIGRQLVKEVFPGIGYVLV